MSKLANQLKQANKKIGRLMAACRRRKREAQHWQIEFEKRRSSDFAPYRDAYQRVLRRAMNAETTVQNLSERIRTLEAKQ